MKKNPLLQSIVKERPLGTEHNKEVVSLLKERFLEAGCEVKELPFECLAWENKKSVLETGNTKLEVSVSPFSKGYNGQAEGILIDSLDSLQKEDLTDKIVFLCKQAAQRALQPKNYPFYYPEEDAAIISRLELQKPKAVISLTGQDQLSGLNPFPMFADGNFEIPSAYISESRLGEIEALLGQDHQVTLHIISENKKAQGSQIVGIKKGASSKEKIVLCAHMDTQYGTMGALDNGTGIAVLMGVMEQLKDTDCDCDIEFVPFNGEEHFEASGELEYLKYNDEKQEPLSLLINIDSPCHIGSDTAVSYYNIDADQEQKIEQVMKQHHQIQKGDPWYAGDHCAFVFSGTPCLAVSSSDLFTGGLADTHTNRDTLQTIDENLVETTATFLAELIKSWRK